MATQQDTIAQAPTEVVTDPRQRKARAIADSEQRERGPR